MDPGEMIEASPFVDYLGIEIIRADEGYGEAKLELDDCHAGPPDGSIAHGGVVSAFADTVAGTATIGLAGQVTPTIDLRIDYLNPADCETLYGTADARRSGDSVVTVDIEITDEHDRDVATARGVFKVTNSGNQSRWQSGWREANQNGEE